MQKLLHHLGVFPQFFKYLRSFGMKTFALDEGFGGFDFCIEKDGIEGAGLKGVGLFSIHYYELPKEGNEPANNAHRNSLPS
jgi:hypothetical protein